MPENGYHWWDAAIDESEDGPPLKFQPKQRHINFFEAPPLDGVEKQMAAVQESSAAMVALVKANAEGQQVYLAQQLAEMQRTMQATLGEMRGTMERTIAERNDALQLAMTERNAPIEILERDERGRITKLRKGSKELSVERGPDGRAVRLG